ncbi:MAG: hypothetical protein KTR31_06330 [Myxococcales bacterium]|nr:hypothetical protein [Myxococcales bacterium]
MSEDAATEQMPASELAELLWDVRSEKDDPNPLSDEDALQPPAPTRSVNSMSGNNNRSEVLTRFPRPGQRDASEDADAPKGSARRWLALVAACVVLLLGWWGATQL